MMTESEEHRNPMNIWEAWKEEADALPVGEVKTPRAGSSQKSLADRLAYLTLEGYLPLLALSAVILSLSADYASATTWLSGLLATPILAILIQPIFRSKQGLKPLTLILAWPLLLLAGSIASALARLLEHRLSTGQIHTEYVAVAWQLSLEGLLTPMGVLLTILVIVLLEFVTAWTHRRFPWVQLRHKGNWWTWIPLLLCVVLTAGVAVPFWKTLRLGSAEQTWLGEMRVLAQVRPYSALSADSKDTFWRDLDAKLKKNLEDNRSHTVTGDDWWSPDDVRAATAGLPIPLLESAPPTSLAEVYAAHNYLSWMGDVNRGSRLRPNLDTLLLRYATRPYRSTGDFTWLFNTLLKDLNQVQDEAILRACLKKIRGLRKALGSPEDGLEERAYHLLVVEPNQLARSEEIGWKAVDNLVRPDKFTKGWSYRANPKPRPLRVLGMEVGGSPTEIGAFYQRRKLLKSWVKFDQKLLGLPWSERIARIREQKEQLALQGTTEDAFWSGLLEWEFVPREISALKQLEIVALLKLHRGRTGKYPRTLQELIAEVDFPTELQSEY